MVQISRLLLWMKAIVAKASARFSFSGVWTRPTAKARERGSLRLQMERSSTMRWGTRWSHPARGVARHSTSCLGIASSGNLQGSGAMWQYEVLVQSNSGLSGITAVEMSSRVFLISYVNMHVQIGIWHASQNVNKMRDGMTKNCVRRKGVLITRTGQTSKDRILWSWV